MHDLRLGEQDILGFLSPASLIGAILYLAIFVLLALLLARGIRALMHTAMTRSGHVDRTTISFLQQMATAGVWVVMLILYAHLIPVLRSMGTALLTGASIASVVIGLAAQSTLGNLVAGVALTIYRPFRLGDTLQVTAPTGTETGTVEMISLGYTTLRTGDGRLVVLPNGVAASSVTVNLSSAVSAPIMTVAIRISRDADVEAVRQLALSVAKETLGEKAVIGCFLNKIEAATAVLELRVRPTPAGNADEHRSALIAALARRFAAAGLNTQGPEQPSFS
jgi:small conductance mechanosensitive channel